MGYCVSQRDGHFTIKKSNKKLALKAMKELMGKANEMGNGGSFANGTVERRWFSWVNTDTVLNAKTLEDALQEWGYEAQTDEEENITYVYFMAEKLGQEFEMFTAIAPFVEPKSYLEMEGEDGFIWRWYFNGKECVEQQGTVSFPEMEGCLKTASGDVSETNIIPEDL